jgi:hypothetical protein
MYFDHPMVALESQADAFCLVYMIILYSVSVKIGEYRKYLASRRIYIFTVYTGIIKT